MKNTHLDRWTAAFALNSGCLPLIFMVALLWGGGQELYTALRNQKPLVITCREYGEKRPSAEWVTMNEARLDFLNSASKQSRLGDRTTEVFIPIRHPNEPLDAPIKILLASEKSETIGLLDAVSQAMNSAGKLTDMRPDLRDEFTKLHSISGLVRFGIHSDSKTLDQLGRLSLPLAEDYVILNEGKQPNATAGLIMFGLGLLLLGYVIRKGLQNPEAPAEPPNLPPLPPSPPAMPPRDE